MMNADGSSNNNLQFDKSNNPNHSNNTKDSNNPNHSNNPKDSYNQRHVHSHNMDNANNTKIHFHLHFHFPETPTTPSSNASADNVDAQISDAQISDVKEGLRDAFLRRESALYQQLSVASDGETAERAMEWQYERLNDKYPLNMSHPRHPFAGICNTTNNMNRNTTDIDMDGDDITECEAKSESLNNNNKKQPNILHPTQFPLQSPFKKNTNPPLPSHAEIEEMQNNMIDVKCNECSKLMAHFVSALDVYPKLKEWECTEIYHCNCIEDGYDLCQKCATAIMMKANQKKNTDNDENDENTEQIPFVDIEDKYAANVLDPTPSPLQNKKRNRKRKRRDFHSNAGSLEKPLNNNDNRNGLEPMEWEQYTLQNGTKNVQCMRSIGTKTCYEINWCNVE